MNDLSHSARGDDWLITDFVSTVPGVAHACGHDLHVSSLLGAAHALTELHRNGMLTGRVRLLLQPAEEQMPGGALHLMNQGVLTDVESIFALHTDPTNTSMPANSCAARGSSRR